MGGKKEKRVKLMVRRTTWVLLIVFGGLVLFAWLFQRAQATKVSNAASATPMATAVRLFDLTNTTVDEFSISSSSGNSIQFVRDPKSTDWIIKDLPADQADSAQIDSISKQFLSLQILDSLVQPPQLDSIGLAKPAYTITLQTADGRQIITDVGSLTPIGTGYYLRVDSGVILIVDNVIIDDVLKLLTEPPVLTTATPEVSGTPIAPVSLNTPTP
jgi:hypothetical protein